MYENFVKKIIDFIIGLFALPFVLLLIIIVAPFLYFDDPGPIFYPSRRAGKNGKIFSMLKFRSM